VPLRHSRVVVNSFVFYILCLRENELFFFLDVVVFQFSESYELKGMVPNYCILQEFVVPRANQMKRFRLIHICKVFVYHFI